MLASHINQSSYISLVSNPQILSNLSSHHQWPAFVVNPTQNSVLKSQTEIKGLSEE